MRLTTFIFIACLAQIAFAQEIDDFKVGDVLYSILPPSEFQKQHGTSWRLFAPADDDLGSPLRKPITGSEVKKLVTDSSRWATLPDARGLFIRGMNAGRIDSYADPDKDRAVASVQSDGFKKHQHHMYGSSGVNDGNHAAGRPDKGWSNADVPTNREYLTDEYTNKNSVPPGGTETRPKNIALYIYIKVDKTE